MWRDAVLEEKHALPGAEGEASLVYRDDFAGAGQCHPQMTWAVIGAFVGVDEKRKIFWDEVVKKGVKISSRLGIRIFHDDKAGTGVLHKNRELSALKPRFHREVS